MIAAPKPNAKGSVMLLLVRFCLFLAAASIGLASAPLSAKAARALIFSHTSGYRHASIEPGIAALQALGKRVGVEMVASEDPASFSPDNLARFDAIVLLSNTTKMKEASSDYFTPSQRAAFEAFVHRGGGVLGIHAATDSHYFWPWYGRMIGGRFTSHPKGTPTGTVRVVDRRHASTKRLPPSQSRADEWYYFDDYNPEMNLLVSLDPASIGEKDVNPNPVSWAHEFEGGRVFYTAMGHTPESFTEPFFLRHVEDGLGWVLRRK